MFPKKALVGLGWNFFFPLLFLQNIFDCSQSKLHQPASVLKCTALQGEETEMQREESSSTACHREEATGGSLNNRAYPLENLPNKF